MGYKSNQEKQNEQLYKNASKKEAISIKENHEQRVDPTKVSEESELVCRICWGTEEEDQNKVKNSDDFNPLISPCKCAGTMGMIHLKCLQGWLETKR